MELNIEEVKEFINSCSDETVIYIGADSQRTRKRKVKGMVRFSVAVICHIEGKHGGRVFGGVTYEKVIDANQGRPFNRMWREAELVVETYELLKEVIGDRVHELHIDINPDKTAGSNIAHSAATGYIKGMTGLDAVTKPEAFAASCVADKIVKTGIKPTKTES